MKIEIWESIPTQKEMVRWTGKNVVDVYNFLEGKCVQSQSDVKTEGENFYIDFCNGGCQLGNLMIKTLEGDYLTNIGDYIVKGVHGEFYPIKANILEKTYKRIR